LQSSGFEVIVAASVAEAITAINGKTFDVLLSDLNIGEPGDGFTVVSAMRRTQPQARTFILTGYPDFDSALKAIRNQVDDYFLKPTNPATLVTCIKESLASPRTPTHLPLRRVSQILQETTEDIRKEFLSEVKSHAEIAAVPLSDGDRVHYVPMIVAELIRRVRSGVDELTDEGRKAAAAIGRQRYEQGYTIPMIVAEARILQRLVTNTLQRNLLRMDMSTLISDMVQVGEALNALLESSIRAFEACVGQRKPIRQDRKPGSEHVA
jgi:ActR/RegA family two-component response regulator